MTTMGAGGDDANHRAGSRAGSKRAGAALPPGVVIVSVGNTRGVRLPAGVPRRHVARINDLPSLIVSVVGDD